MRCLVCSKRIGILRRLVDGKFCCNDHRNKARKSSARAVRDAADFEGLEEPWLVTPGLENKKQTSSGNSLGPLPSLFLIIGAGVLVWMSPSGNAPMAAPGYSASGNSMGQRLDKVIPGRPSFSIRADLRTGLGEWIGARTEARHWSYRAGAVHPGQLRLWKPTLAMSDYELAFQGQIESKAISWAFRAKNLDNYYATKISITKPGPLPRAEIVRYAVINGRREVPVQLPLPLTIREDTLYQVKVAVKADRFSTVVNGQVVDSWSDQRLSTGGVGFFADPGEQASLVWVRVSGGESLIKRLLAFSLLIGPPQFVISESR